MVGYTPFNTQRGTMVGYHFNHPGRHPGGIYPLYTREAPWWDIPIIHPERHPGGYIPPVYTQRGTLVGIYAPLYTQGGYPGGYMLFCTPREATLVGIYQGGRHAGCTTGYIPGREACRVCTMVYTQEREACRVCTRVYTQGV